MSFINFENAFKDESTYRLDIEFEKLCTYGMKPLDDSLLAIAKNELIVIAAGSGYGKTELSLHISRTNALKGKKVAHYNLEGGYREAIQRMKWRDMIDLYFTEHRGENLELDYRSWVLNKDKNPLFLKLEAQVYSSLKEKMGENLYLYDNPEGLNCKSFCESLITLEGLRADMMLDPILRRNIRGVTGLDLIVIDHLQYFSLGKDENEISEITEILKTVKIITEEMQIPVILVAHLRKLPRGHGIPDKEDIYGTGNIHKIANTCIILSPDHEKDDSYNGIYPTHIRIAKSRQGLRPNLLIYSKFDSHTRQYGKTYELYKSYPNGSVDSEPISDDQKPKWARGPTNSMRVG
jgi:archaellum biogenesis ATPase FlaH